MSEQNLKKYIAELIQEVEKELEESTTTANVDGYQTPHAFSRKKDNERRKKNATQLGYTLVDDNVDNITEAISKISPSNFKKLEAGIKKIDPKIKISLDSSAPGGFEIKIPDDSNGKWVSSTDKINALVYKITGDQRNGRIFFEGKDFKTVKKDKYGNHLEPQFKKGDKVKYLGNKAVITRVNRESSGVYSYDVDYYKGNGRTKASNIFNKDGKTIQLESVNEAAKPSQVRSVISRVKKDLMKKWKQKGGYENFGDKEGDMLRKKFNFNPYGSPEEREIAKMIQGFEDWAMNYDGNMREAKFGYKTSTASYINKHKDEYKVAEKMNKGNEMKFYDDLQAMEDKIGHPKTMLFISNALRGYGVDMYKDPKIKNPADAQEALFLLSK